MEFTTWLLLSSIELFGMLFLFAQITKKIQSTQFRMRLGWGFFVGGIGVKIMLYGIEMTSLTSEGTFNIFK